MLKYPSVYSIFLAASLGICSVSELSAITVSISVINSEVEFASTPLLLSVVLCAVSCTVESDAALSIFYAHMIVAE